MGQHQSPQTTLNTQLTLIQQLPIGKVYQSSSKTLHFIKQYAYTSEQAFQQAFLKFSAKLTSKNDNVLTLQKTNTKVDNTFCSTFYKILLVFEYLNYSLADQIAVRNKENRLFQEKQIWSILFHCTLGIAHLKRTEGHQHSAIGLKDIKLSEDGTIKILPLQMVGISTDHDLNQGTTKKLAMTILSCILMKPVSNQSCEYLQALIDKTKCSKELKKVLYFMVMDDTTFKQLQEYLYKLANDQNDTRLSGVSTPMCSNQKRSIRDSNVKKFSEELNKKLGFAPNQTEKQDIPNVCGLPHFYESLEIENPDETDQKDKFESPSVQQATIVQSLNEPASVLQTTIEPPTFCTEAPPSMDYKLKDYSASFDDVTVRMISKKNADFTSFTQTYSQEIQQKPNDLYTDPKLLDLIKKDLQEIQQKSRVNYNAMIKESTSTSNFKMINATNVPEVKEQKQLVETGQKARKNAIYMMSSADFNLKPVRTQALSVPAQKITKPLTQKPQGSMKQTDIKKSQQPESNKESALKQIENVPKRAKQQQCFGNILDGDSDFKKAKSKKSVTTTVTIRQSEKEIRKDEQKQNNYESSETKRIVQNYQKNQEVPIQQNKSKSSQARISSQLGSQTSLKAQQNSQGLQYVTETYQKGEYKGYKLNGLRHGHGTFYYKQGGKYVGEWRQNKMNGRGTLYYPNESIAYEGNWKDDQLHGYGTLYNQQVSKLQRAYDYQDWSCVQQYWVRYEGEFNRDNKQGRGRLQLSNGEVFEGGFKEDMVEGEGVISRGNGTRVRGVWRKNKLLRIY